MIAPFRGVTMLEVLRRTLAIVAVAVVAGCDARPDVTAPREEIPYAAQHHEDSLAVVGTSAMSKIFVYDTNIWDASDPTRHGGPRLYITAGHVTEDGYLADGLVIADLVPGILFLRDRTVVVKRCTGTATYADETWTIALGGGAECEHYNGVFRARPTWAESWDDPRLHPVAAAPAPPPTLRIVLPPPTTPFAQALAGIDSMEPSDRPCPIALRAPHAALTESSDPGAAALAHRDERNGEEFGIVHATSGEPLPSAPDSPLRYQAIFVRTDHRDPRILDGRSFIGGLSRGRAFLIDTTAGRVVCVGDVSATNGDSMEGSSERHAAMWLTLQLLTAEQRAIALGLHAPAEREAE